MAAKCIDYDVLIVGSGFGGSVAALRLTEKGYRVGVLEAGPAKATLDGRDWILLQPDAASLHGPPWSNGTNWQAELADSFEQAKVMLGNALTKTYRYLAELAGAELHGGQTAVRIRPLPGGGYVVFTVRSGAWRAKRTERPFTAGDVVVAAGSGTRTLLCRMVAHGYLSGLSSRLRTAGICTVGHSAETGVVDAYHRAYGHEGLHIIDGSTVPANIGANPSLTITALAERAMSLWPNNGDRDPRPPLGDAYRRVTPVPPWRPVLPDFSLVAERVPVPPARGGSSWSHPPLA